MWTYAFGDSGACAGHDAFEALAAVGAEGEGGALLSGGEEGGTFFEACFEGGEGFLESVQEPFQFIGLCFLIQLYVLSCCIMARDGGHVVCTPLGHTSDWKQQPSIGFLQALFLLPFSTCPCDSPPTKQDRRKQHHHTSALSSSISSSAGEIGGHTAVDIVMPIRPQIERKRARLCSQ